MSHYKSPLVMREAKAFFELEEAKAFVRNPRGFRARRNPRNLPNSYDDIPQSNEKHHSWKRNRGTQYRAKG